MSDYKTVQELKEIDVNIAALFRSILILRRKTTKTAKNGNPFLSIELGDGSGSFNANCFGDSDVFKALDPVEEGSIVRLAGKTEYYMERFSPKLQAAEVIEAEEAEAEGMMANLVETPPENATSPLRLRTTSSAVASSLFADSPTSAQPQMKSTLQRHDSVANFSYRVPSDDESSVDDRAEETCSLSEFAVLLNVAFWDENADGRITEREVRFNVGRLRSVGVDTMAIEALLDKARQENADVSVGTLSKVLHNAHANVAQAMTVFAHFDQHAVLHATHILDEMDTGYVTVDSVKTVMKRLGVKSSEADIVAMMAQADTSGNGQVKTKEFTRLLATELKVLREQQTKDMSTFELGSDGVVGEMDDFEDGSVHSNLSSSDTIELAEKVLLKSALKMQKDAQDKLMQRGKKGGGKNNKNNSEDSKDQQSAETGALAEETYELSIEEYKVERHGSVLAAKREMLRVPSFGVLKNFPSSRKDRDISVKKGEVTMKKSITWSDTDTLETYCLYDRQTGDMMFVSEDGERTSLPMRDDYFTGRTRSIAAAKAARDADRNPSCCSIM